ncbi:MAG TPA: hypothetical protein VLI72_14480 [Methylibium sp.]|nr:hypothetical protein [Methylibium sp.]
MNQDDAADDPLEAALRASRGLEAPPAAVLQRVIDLWPAAAAPAAAGALRRVLAALSFDSGRAAPLAFGMRGSEPGPRQLLFSAEDHDIDLRIAAAGTGWALHGQVLGPDAGGRACLIGDDGAERAVVALDELGEFRFDALPAGRYALRLELADRQIELPAVGIPAG